MKRTAPAILVLFLISAAAYRHRWDPLFDRVNRPRIVSRIAAGVTPATSDSSLVFVFRPQDCPGARRIIKALNVTRRERRIPVMGVLVGDSLSMPRWQAIVASSDVHFPTVLMSAQAAGVVARSVAGMTPALVMLDLRRGDFHRVPDTLARWLVERISKE